MKVGTLILKYNPKIIKFLEVINKILSLDKISNKIIINNNNKMECVIQKKNKKHAFPVAVDAVQRMKDNTKYLIKLNNPIIIKHRTIIYLMKSKSKIIMLINLTIC